jgi:glycosyltransferase involved in cell wall biosynthesis
MDLVSVVIPTYNRFEYLKNTIKSVENQDYQDIEIIVVNDCSTQEQYYDHYWGDVTIIHLQENTKKTFGFPCVNHVRNEGIKNSNGKYIAFCDDDDIWLNGKTRLQIEAMKQTGCKMSSTDGLIGNGVYDPSKKYRKYNSEYFYDVIENIYKNENSSLFDNGFPKIWNLDFLKVHNCMINSSVILEKDVIEQMNYFNLVPSPGADYNSWLKASKFTNSVYVDEICFYYDTNHGNGVSISSI